ncbi:hypothetical protein [Paenibacillus sp. YYML68]|uniref:hypothetical protein n=1 Tax=Paenibacillus sp. YYML68 TaxID=2909250 RepID=UPI0024918928|nr:hypothetical protein [Paenibacillus sp. YYML68]
MASEMNEIVSVTQEGMSSMQEMTAMSTQQSSAVEGVDQELVRLSQLSGDLQAKFLA